MVYLDYNATTPLETAVQEEICRSLREDWGNASSSHQLGMKSRKVLEESRENVAKMINAKADDIVFTSGGTEANNVALMSAIKAAKKVINKPHVITSSVEHDSVIKLLLDLRNQKTIELSIVEADVNGFINADSVCAFIKDETCLISVMHANNESGVIMPIEQIGCTLQLINSCRSEKNLFPILFHTDAAQTIGKIEIDVQNLKVDYLTIVGHKFYAPRIGALYARDAGKQTPVHPIILGGGQERNMRPGTENIPMIAGLGLASSLVLENVSMYKKDMQDSRDYFKDKLKDMIPSIEFNFIKVDRLPNTLSVKLPPGSKASDVLKKCEGKFYASLGAACHSNVEKPSAVLIASGLSEEEAGRTIRFSVGRSTTKDELDFVCDTILAAL